MSLEKDFLQYKGNRIPRAIRLFWTVFLIFAAYYLISNMLPDLKVWMSKIK